MAARRLIVVMLVMLAIATLSAALVPPNPPGAGEDGTETEVARESDRGKNRREADGGTKEADGGTGAGDRSGQSDRGSGGELVRATVTAGGELEVVPLTLGDQLALEVRANPEGLIEIPALGLTDFAGAAPARFDLLPDRAGDHVVRRSGGAPVARIEVRPGRPARAD